MSVERAAWASARGFTVIAIAVAGLWPKVAVAQDAGAPPPDPSVEIAALERAILRDAEALTSGGCAVACQALGSMARSAERLCALDPGPRCASARAKVREAERRVREACAECRAVDEPPVRASTGTGSKVEGKPVEVTAPQKVAPREAPPSADLDSERVHPAAPAATKRGGGCAGCEIGGDTGAAGAGALAIVGLAIALLRKRSRRRL